MLAKVLLPLVLVAAVIVLISLRRAGVIEATASNIGVVILIVIGVAFGVYRSRHAHK